MSPPARRIQLVLQGGGAKLYALIAAIEAVAVAERENKISVTRISGTSAGAIVGSLYAAGVAPQTMRQAFAALDLRSVLGLASWLPKSFQVWRQLKKVLDGKPIASDEPLKNLLLNLFEQAGLPDPRFRHLRTPLVVVASDVSARDRLIYDSRQLPDSRVVPSVLDSCALPFFFRTANQGSQPLILDGGLCENLPVEALIGDAAEFGDIVAFCFRDTPGPTPRSAVDLGKALLDTAINASVSRSRALGNAVLVDLNPYDVGTFDFERAQQILKGEEGAPYDNARQCAETKIAELCEASGNVLSTSRWDSADPTMMDQLWTLHMAQQSHRLFKYFRRRLTIEANSLLSDGEEDHGSRDRVVQTFEFAPTRWPVDNIMSMIFVESGQKPSNVFCQIWGADNSPIRFLEPLPAKPANEPDTYGVLISFAPPIEPSNPLERVFVRTEFRMHSVLPHLCEAGNDGRFVDSAGTRIRRADGTVDLVELVLRLPVSLGRIGIRNHAECDVKAAAFAENEIQDLLGECKGHFRPFGWRARDVPNEKRVLIEIERMANATR